MTYNCLYLRRTFAILHLFSVVWCACAVCAVFEVSIGFKIHIMQFQYDLYFCTIVFFLMGIKGKWTKTQDGYHYATIFRWCFFDSNLFGKHCFALASLHFKTIDFKKCIVKEINVLLHILVFKRIRRNV